MYSFVIVFLIYNLYFFECFGLRFLYKALESEGQTSKRQGTPAQLVKSTLCHAGESALPSVSFPFDRLFSSDRQLNGISSKRINC